MKKYVVLFFILLPSIFFVFWVISLNNQLQQGQEVRIQIQGYDPRDLLSGHYILYQNNLQSVEQKTVNTLCVKKDFYGSHRFYIPEANAEELDKLFRSSSRENHFEIIYSCVKGRKPIAKKLLINEKDWREFLKGIK